MKSITRRSAITGALTLGAGLCFPWSLAQAFPSPTKWTRWPPTEADLALIRSARRRAPDHLGSEISRIQVHQLFHNLMSIEHFEGVKIEAVDYWAPSVGGHSSYFWITYKDRTRFGCTYPLNRIEEWAHLNAYSREFIPLNFPKEGIS